MPPRNLSPNLAPRSCQRSFGLMVTYVTPATSRPGSTCSSPTSARSSRRAARLPKPPTTFVVWHWPHPRQSRPDEETMAHHRPLAEQAQLAYDAALINPCPDWRAVAELLRAALGGSGKQKAKSATPEPPAIADYNVD